MELITPKAVNPIQWRTKCRHIDPYSSVSPEKMLQVENQYQHASMNSDPHHDRKESAPSEAAEPTLASNPYNPNSVAYLAYPVKHVVSSLYRRMTEPPDQPVSRLLDAPQPSVYSNIYTPPRRTESPFHPPPLTPLALTSSHPSSTYLLTRSLAEEIRLLVPPRLQLVDSWRLAYSLEADGASLATLYKGCETFSSRSQQAGYVMVIHDGASKSRGSLFGAYLTDAPRPWPHYYGTGECFLWRASILPSIQQLQLRVNDDTTPPTEDLLQLAGLPPPPSADTTHAQRATTIQGEKKCLRAKPVPWHSELLEPPTTSRSGTSTPDRIRFKAFPYSGINDFMIFCEHGYLSVGGGDGHYGLWLDDTLESGISEACPAFGNEPLSEAGHKFDVLGVEIWYIGA